MGTAGLERGPHPGSKAGHFPLGHRRSRSAVGDAKPAAGRAEVWRDGGFSLWGFTWSRVPASTAPGQAPHSASPTLSRLVSQLNVPI